MVNIVKIVIPLLFLLTLGASWPAHGEAVSIMTFNVENLFDNTDDPGKRDETYLPKETKTNQLHIEKCHQVKVRRWRRKVSIICSTSASSTLATGRLICNVARSGNATSG